MNAGVLIFDGFDELDVIGPYEVLDNARLLGADVQVRLVGRRAWRGWGRRSPRPDRSP